MSRISHFQRSSMLLVVAVCGTRRAGKDTVSDYLCTNHGFVKASFAAPLKGMVRAAFGFSPEQVDGALKDTVDPVHGITPRQAMQFMGTEVMQYEIKRLLPHIVDTRVFWAERFVRDSIYSSDNKNNKEEDDRRRIVVSDMRFPHEQRTLAQAVQRAGGRLHVWRVTRPHLHPSLEVNDVDAHASEQEVNDIPVDALLTNDADLASLYGSIEQELQKCIDKE